MKYIGSRTCHCPIEDDDYWGSGTIIRRAIKKYEKEKEIIATVDAVRSLNYYNIAPGGPSRPEGFVMSIEERNKMDYLNFLMNNEILYCARIEDRSDTHQEPQIIIGEIEESKMTGTFFTFNLDKIYRKYSETWIKQTSIKQKEFQYPNIVSWLHDMGHMLISKETYYKYYKVSPGTFYDYVQEIAKKHEEYIQRMNQSHNTNAVITKKEELTNTKKTNMDYITEYAKTSKNYRNFLNLYNKYKDLGLVAIYHAVTGHGSITANCLKDGKLVCTDKQVENAAKILDYELLFKNIGKKIGGRQDYFYMAVAFCYNYDKVDNTLLYKKLRDNHKKMKPFTSLDDTICQISRIYDNRNKNKAFIKQEYEKNKSKV